MRHNQSGFRRLAHRPGRLLRRLVGLAGAAALGYYLLEKNKQSQPFDNTAFIDPLDDESPEVIDVDVDGDDSNVF